MVTHHVGSSVASLAHNTDVLLPKWLPERKGRRRGDYCTITRNQPRFCVILGLTSLVPRASVSFGHVDGVKSRGLFSIPDGSFKSFENYTVKLSAKGTK